MKQKCYSEKQIIQILKEAESGTLVANVCRKYGISDCVLHLDWEMRDLLEGLRGCWAGR